MLSEGKNIDRVFREKAEAFNPGRTMLEADWAGISGQLPVKQNTRRPVVTWLRSAAAVAAIVVVFFAIKGLVNRKDEKVAVPVAKNHVLPADTVKTAVNGDTAAKPVQLIAPDLFANLKLPYHYIFDDHVFISPDFENNHASARLQEDFHRQVAVQPESFTINNNRDNNITCKQGTSVFIPANTFYSGGALINGDITFSVTEYYTLAEMAAAKLNTTSAGQILKSGGMLYIQAMYKNQAVDAELRHDLSVNMPANKDYDPQMQLFLPALPNDYAMRANLSVAWSATAANFSSSNTFEWLPAGQLQNPASEQPSRIVINERADTVTGGYRRFRVQPVPRGAKPTFPPVLIPTINIIQPYKIIEKTNTAVFLTDYLAAKDEAGISEQLKSRFPGYNIKLRSNFVGRKQFITQSEEKVPQYISVLNDSTWMPFEFAFRNGYAKPADSIKYAAWLNNSYKLDTIYTQYMAGIDRKAEENEQNFNTGVKILEGKYHFSISRLGWINCDRFYNDSREKVNLYVQLEGSLADYTVHIVFPRINAIAGIASVTPGNKLMFANFPLGEPIYIVAVGARNGKIITGFKETTVSAKPVTGIHFEESNADAFKQKLAQLN